MRRTSVSLPTKHNNVAHDPYEKPDRYQHHGHDRRDAGILEKLKDDMMSQAQKTRWFKTGAIVFIFVVALYYFHPSGVEVYRGCEFILLPSSVLHTSLD